MRLLRFRGGTWEASPATPRGPRERTLAEGQCLESALRILEAHLGVSGFASGGKRGALRARVINKWTDNRKMYRSLTQTLVPCSPVACCSPRSMMWGRRPRPLLLLLLPQWRAAAHRAPGVPQPQPPTLRRRRTYRFGDTPFRGTRLGIPLLSVRHEGQGEAPPPVRTAVAHTVAAHALIRL